MKLKLVLKNGRAEIQNAKTGEVLENVTSVDYSESVHDYPVLHLTIVNVSKVMAVWTPKRSKIVINWRVFEDNTSTAEELMGFAEGRSSIKEFKKNCWPKECKQEINKLAKLSVKEARHRARKYCNRVGIILDNDR